MPDDDDDYSAARPRRAPHSFEYWEPFLSDTELDRTSLRQRRVVPAVLDDFVQRGKRAGVTRRRLGYAGVALVVLQVLIAAFGAFLGIQAAKGGPVVEYCTATVCSAAPPSAPIPTPFPTNGGVLP